MDTEMTAPIAATAMATVIVEPWKRSRMTVSFCLQLTLLQRISFKFNSLHGVPGCRIGASTLRKGKLFHAPSMQQPRQAIVSFDAARLGINSIFLVALPGELLPAGPWPCPHGRIFDRYSVFERGWPGPRPALDQVQVLA